jgi:hypothetical protein
MTGSKKNETPKTPENQQPSEESSSQTAQATAAASAAITGVREKLVAGEQLALLGALSIVGLSWFVFSFLLDKPFIVSDFAVMLSVLLVLAIWVHRWGHYDFGKPYRIIIAALGVSLAILALMNFLTWARPLDNSGDLGELLGRLAYWGGGVATFIGAWQVFRTRED